MIGYQGVGHDALLQPEVFEGVAGIQGVTAGFKLLPVAAGMDAGTQVVVLKNGQFGNVVAYPVIGLLQSFQADAAV